MSARPDSFAALNRDPLDPNKLLAAAQRFSRSGNVAIAYHLLERANQLTPHPSTLLEEGLAALQIASTAGDDDWLRAAEKLFVTGLELAPDNQDLITALGAVALQLGDLEQAEQLSAAVVKVNPANHHARHTLGYVQLYRGQWGDAWDNYESHAGKPPVRVLPMTPVLPYWAGEKGGHLLVIGEQGIGDEITFASVVEDAARENRITLWCDARLESLFARSMPYATVEGRRQVPRDPESPLIDVPGVTINYVPDAKYRCLAGSLCTHYRRDADAFPRHGFLKADPILRAEMRTRLDALPGRKVGIAWTGGKPPSYWHRRRLERHELEALIDIPGVSWVSLQYDKPEPAMVNGLPIHHWPDVVQFWNYDRTAALVAELDAVVCVPTAVAHLAGALGKRCYVMANELPRWFYGLQGTRSAWYDSLTIFRQRRVGGELVWPINDVRRALGADE